jgi:pimeloyl-ACP methyl ester carboxylesterase
VRTFMPADSLDAMCEDLRSKIVVPDAGHWVQQEAPTAVNSALLEFLTDL